MLDECVAAVVYDVCIAAFAVLIKRSLSLAISQLLNLLALISPIFNEVWVVLCADFLDLIK